MEKQTSNHRSPKIKVFIEHIIFSSKWLLIPFYLGLICAQIIYLKLFCEDISQLFVESAHLDKEAGVLIILELVDIVMVANLIKMIISGSYHSFISKEHSENSEKSSSGLLKVKMATSLIGVSSIHLLQTFLNIKELNWSVVKIQLCIHVAFLIGAVTLAVIEFIHIKGEKIEHEMGHGQQGH